MPSRFQPDPRDDPQGQRVYQAEDMVLDESRGRPSTSLAEVEDWLASVYGTRWFQNRLGAVTKGCIVHDGRRSSWARGPR